MASGNATKSFSPFISPRDIKANPEKAQSKVMVDFDPLKCLLGDLEASMVKSVGFVLAVIFPHCINMY